VGDPRPEKERIDYGDGWRGTPLVVAISSPAPPAIDGDLKIRMDQVGEGRYTATFTPQTSGIYYIGDYGISVNYPIEYRDVGFNPEFVDAIESSGGRVFTEDEARTSLIVEARRSAQKTVQEKVSKGAPLLLAALLIFLSEIILRRMREVRQKGRGS
jgi:hypothetical protein